MSNQTIAILGKPNVGKSTLFNRLIGDKHSIVSSEEGVTRDSIYGKFDWQGREFNLIDTGGYSPDTKDIIESHVRIQTELAADEADIIILLVDGRKNITTSDQLLARQIQKLDKPFILAVNKIDELHMENLAIDYFELGLGDFITLSAQNNRKIGDMLDKVISELPPDTFIDEKIKNYINLAIVGMPNSGKSSLMNTLVERQKSIVTPIAGTTRDSIDSLIKFNKHDIRLIDTAGLRKKSKISGDIEFYSTVRTFRVIQGCDISAVIIDANKGFNNQDKDIIRNVIGAGKALIIVVNKWDLLKKIPILSRNIKRIL